MNRLRTTAELRGEIDRLKLLVEDAYKEGADDAHCDAVSWAISEAKSNLEKEQDDE